MAVIRVAVKGFGTHDQIAPERTGNGLFDLELVMLFDFAPR